MQVDATNFQYNSILGAIRQKWLKISKQITKQHKHQSISGLELQIHNFDTYAKITFLMPNHNNRPYLILVLTPVNRKYIEISLSSLEYKH